MSTSMLQSTFNNHMFWNAPNEAQMAITAQQFSRPDITRILERFARERVGPSTPYTLPLPWRRTILSFMEREGHQATSTSSKICGFSVSYTDP